MKSKIVNSSPGTGKKQKTDWNKLWSSARMAFDAAGLDRQKAILDNFAGQKEEICRTLNIVSMADLTRIQRRIEAGTKGK